MISLKKEGRTEKKIKAENQSGDVMEQELRNSGVEEFQNLEMYAWCW